MLLQPIYNQTVARVLLLLLQKRKNRTIIRSVTHNKKNNSLPFEKLLCINNHYDI